MLHTAFAINKSIEEAKENKNKFVKQSETVDVPLILTHVDNQPAEEDDFEKQIEEAEIIMFGNNKKNNQRVIPENKFSRNEPVGEVNFIQENEPVDEESELPEEVEEVEEVDVEEENEPEEILIEDPGNESENIINVEQVSNNTSQVINPSNFTGENIDPTNFRRMIEESELEEQNGGDGYYTAVEKLPIAGRPVIRGYKSCCQPYFRTDGQEFDHLCQMGGMGNHVSLNSKTLLMVKNGVIYSITASVIDSIGENTAKMMGMKGVHKKQIKDHMKQHMHNHTYNVVKEMVTNGSNALSGVIPQNDFMFSLVPVRTHFSQHGGNYIGTLGTLLFPSGNPAGNIVPWLLTLGSVLFKRIERDIYKISHKLGKKKVTRKPSKKKVTRKPLKKKVTRKSSKKKVTRKPSKKKVTRKPSKKRVTKKKVNRKPVTIRSSKKWEPLTNANIRRLMRKGQLGGQLGGDCGSGLCGDPSLKYFEGCKRPEWGVGAKAPMCI